jgi:hypothetical protein
MATMTTLSRRDFLKLAFGTVSAAALTGPLALLWPEAAKARPMVEPAELFLDDDHCLVDGPYRDISWDPPTRREYHGLDRMTLRARYQFWRDWATDDDFQEFLYDGRDVADWTAEDRATFEAFEAEYAEWLDETMDLEELPERELALMTEYGPAIELYEELGPERAVALGLYEAVIGSPGASGYAIGFAGDVEQLNAALAAAGINVVVHQSLYDDEDWADAGDAEATA